MSQGGQLGDRQVVTPNDISGMFDAVRNGANIDYNGASGAVNFAIDGHVEAFFGIWQIENSAYVFKKNLAPSELTVFH